MIEDPKKREDNPTVGMSDDLHAIDRAMLLALSHRQRDSTPLSLDQESLLNRWIIGSLPVVDADRAAELTKHNKFAAERVLERRLIAAANEGSDVPSSLTERALKTSRPQRAGAGGIFSARWPTLSGWQWSGLGAAVAATAVITIFGFQFWQARLQPDQSFQIAMVTIEDRSVFFEGPRFRTRGNQQQAPTGYTSLSENPAESRFRDVDVPTALLRRAVTSASTKNGVAEHAELMNYLGKQYWPPDNRARILIDSALAESLLEKPNERINIQIRVFDLDDLHNATIRSKIRTLQAGAHFILLTLRQ